MGAFVLYGAGCVWSCPAAPAPACTLHRSSTTPVALLTNTAMLDGAAVVPGAETKPKSSTVTAAVTWTA